MAGNITFTMIKPGAVRKGFIVPILEKINRGGFRISAMKLTQLSVEQAMEFYKIHADKPFYHNLCKFMSSGPIVIAILVKENAVADFRALIGSTDPNRAEEGTIRKLYAESVEKNAIHGSDSDENAIIESDFFFSKIERFSV
jgi:nucleoside-diphosphate kinase